MTINRLLIPKYLIAEIRAQVSTNVPRKEAGGLLLGFRKSDAIQLEKITYPNRWDRATPILFERSALGHRIAALRAWKTSGGEIDWVGEWHTHPFGSSRPSSIDRISWRKITSHTKRPMIFIIAGRSDIFIGLQAKAERNIRPFKIIGSDANYVLHGID